MVATKDTPHAWAERDATFASWCRAAALVGGSPPWGRWWAALKQREPEAVERALATLAALDEEGWGALARAHNRRSSAAPSPLTLARKYLAAKQSGAQQ